MSGLSFTVVQLNALDKDETIFLTENISPYAFREFPQYERFLCLFEEHANIFELSITATKYICGGKCAVRCADENELDYINKSFFELFDAGEIYVVDKERFTKVMY